MQQALQLYDWLATPDAAAAIWQVVRSGVAAVYAIHFASLAWQSEGLAGPFGLFPVSCHLVTIISFVARYGVMRLQVTKQMTAYWRDFGWKTLFYWPSVFYPFQYLIAPAKFGSFLRLYLFSCSALAILTLLHLSPSTLSFACLWISHLSVDTTVVTLAYPWDSLLFEAGFLLCFAPEWGVPSVLLRFSFRWLIARLMIGFGKLKFIGSTSADKFYIKHFMVTQPIPSKLGLLLARALPDFVWIASIFVMFVIEIPLPMFSLFFSGWPRILTAVGTIFLMIGIQMGGNFGYFNMLTCILCFPLLSHQDSVFTWDALHVSCFSDGLYLVLFFAYMFPASIPAFLLNTWMNLGWNYWPTLQRFQPAAFFKHYLAYLRCFSQFRIIQAFGVFPPNAFPPVRYVPRYRISFRSNPHRSTENTTVHVKLPYLDSDTGITVAPHHPRLDHGFFYEAVGMGRTSFASPLGHHSPYKMAQSNNDCFRLQAQLGMAVLDRTAAAAAESLAGARGIHCDALAALKMFDESTTLWPTKDVVTHANGEQMYKDWRYCGPAVTVEADLVRKTLSKHGSGYNEAFVGMFSAPMVLYHLISRTQSAGGDTEYRLIMDDEYYANSVLYDISSVDDFWCEAVFWRNSAVERKVSIQRSDYEQCWDTIHRIRTACISYAKQMSTEDVDTPSKPLRLNSDGSYCWNEVFTTVRKRIPADRRTLEAAITFAEARNNTGTVEEWPAWVANALFTFNAVPFVVSELRKHIRPTHFAQMRKTWKHLIAPLMQSVEAVFWRHMPSQKHQEGADINSVDDLFAMLSEMINGSPTGARGVPPTANHISTTESTSSSEQMTSTASATATSSTVEIAGKEYEIAKYASNDDAGVAGCMRNHLQMHMYCNWLMLTAGRAQFERICGGIDAILHREAASATLDLQDMHAVKALFMRIIPDVSLGPHCMGSEAGLLLRAVFEYDVFQYTVSRAPFPAVPSRIQQKKAIPTFYVLPGMLDYMDRMSVHPEWSIWDGVSGGFAPPPVPPELIVAADGDWQVVDAVATHKDGDKKVD